MEGVMHVLAHGGMLPQYQPPPSQKTISPRRKGVKQGTLLMLIGALLVPVLGVMAAFSPGPLENVFGFFAALTAIICFVGGPLRMLFAAIFEEGAKARHFVPPSSYVPPQHARVSALPPPSVHTEPWRARPQTAEITQPPSVTDHTTRLLEKSESEKE
jgi:hypothetical protein